MATAHKTPLASYKKPGECLDAIGPTGCGSSPAKGGCQSTPGAVNEPLHDTGGGGEQQKSMLTKLQEGMVLFYYLRYIAVNCPSYCSKKKQKKNISMAGMMKIKIVKKKILAY